MEHTGKIAAAVAKVAAEIGSFSKDAKNKEQGYAFASVEKIKATIIPTLSAEGVVITPSKINIIENIEIVSARGAKGRYWVLSIEFVFTHKDGETMQVHTLGEAIDYGDKGLNKATTSAYKNLLKICFGVSTHDDADNDHNTPNVEYETVQKQQQQPEKWLSDEQVSDAIEQVRNNRCVTFKNGSSAATSTEFIIYMQQLGYGINKKHRQQLREAF